MEVRDKIKENRLTVNGSDCSAFVFLHGSTRFDKSPAHYDHPLHRSLAVLSPPTN